MSNREEAQSLQLAFSLHRSGNFAEAAKLYRKITKRNPRESHALHSLGIIEAAAGNHAEAARLMARSLSVQPNNIQFMQNYATVLCQMGQYEVAAAVCLRGLEADSTNVYLLYVAAGAQFKQNRLQESLSKFDALLSHDPNHVAAITERSAVLMALKQYDAALAGIEKAIALTPEYVEAHLNRGVVYGQLKRHDEAIGAFDLALKLDPNLTNAWLGCGNVYFDSKRYQEAFAAYDKALSLKPDLAEAWLGRGNIFFDLKRYDEALAGYDKALSFKSDLAEAWLGRGNSFFDLKRYDEAFAAYDKALSFEPDSAKAMVGRANAFVDLKRYDEAFAAYDAALAINPDLVALKGDRLHSKMHLCDWTDFEVECDNLVQSIRNGKDSCSPFPFLVAPSSAKDQLDCARLWIKNKYPPFNEPAWRRERYVHDRLRVAYMSSDFRQHPTAYLAVGLFENHDRSRFEITGISLEKGNGSELGQRLAASFDRSVEVETQSDDQIARLIKDLEIDILVDLNGHTKGSRMNVLTRRPAPIQVNYLGYPGTTGADYVDYIIADRTVVPETHHAFYSEKMALLPNSYQVNDADRGVAGEALSRSALGLPPTGFVFCCFNNGFKFTPPVFDGWMRILKQVDTSVLWLLEETPTAAVHLRQQAAARGVSAERLVFAKRTSHKDHMARHGAADLFLDTLPYNAHTTASDALWAGVPVLTRPGETFAGRVAASLLTAIGLPELIAPTPAQFESMAVELANDPEALAVIKRKLAQNRSITPLFDTKLYARHLESAYTAMVERHHKGLPPDHIHVRG